MCVLRGYPAAHTSARINPWTVTERGTEQVVKLEKIIVIHDLRRQGLSISAIARKSGLDRKTTLLNSYTLLPAMVRALALCHLSESDV